MILMATATLALALIPGVKSLGLASTMFFFLCRIGQGFAVGGKYGTAMTYAYELPPQKRTFYRACIIASTHIGGLLASFLASIYLENFRIVFLIGGLMGFGILLFRSLVKDCHILRSKTLSEITKVSLKNKKAILEAFIVASLLVLVFYGSFIYLNEFLHKEMHISRAFLFKDNPK